LEDSKLGTALVIHELNHSSRQGLQMAFEYCWWDLEESSFKGVLYNTIGNFWLHDHPYKTWEEFEADLPHMAFAHLVYTRFEMLERLFVDLRVVTQILGATEVPVKSTEMNINRYDWLKLALDLKLLRFASIRDVSFHFINEVVGLDIEERRVNRRNLIRVVDESRIELISIIDEISDAGTEIREERNIRAHIGIANLGTDDDQMFKSASWAETKDMVSNDYDLAGIYHETANRMYERLISETNALLAIVIRLVDELVPDFQSIYQQKRLTTLKN
jgi:hypothetical protein